MAKDSYISIDTVDGPMPAYEVAPERRAKGGVVVVQEALGVTPHIEDMARQLAADGWHAVAPALFHRQGAPVFNYEDAELVMPLMDQLNREDITTDLTATFDHLERTGFNEANTAVIGFCMGGTVTFFAGTLRPLGAIVTFYGGGVAEERLGLPSAIDLAPELKTPWLGLYADLDEFIPISDVERLRAAATAHATVPHEIIRYPDAHHGFTCKDRPAFFDQEVANDAWDRTLEWINRYLRSS
jgi:carboxymethylenebutenolidase